MRWYKYLYVGDNAKNAKYDIIVKTTEHRLQLDAYLITLPSNEKNLLDIIPARELAQPYYKNREVSERLFVVGIAKGEEEAQLVSAKILMDTHRATNGFRVRSYLHCAQTAREAEEMEEMK